MDYFHFLVPNKCIFQVWDTSGAEHYASIVHTFLKEASFYLFCFDLNKETTAESIDAYIKIIKERILMEVIKS